MVSDYVEMREGNYFVRGSRVSLDSVVYGFINGDSPPAVRENFPTLTLAQIDGAITFYLAHRSEIDAYLEGKKEAYEAARRSQPDISIDLRKRIEQAREQASLRTYGERVNILLPLEPKSGTL